MNVAASRVIKTEAGQVWSLLADFGNMSWILDQEMVEVIGSGPGMIRRVHMPDLEPFDEVLDGLEAEGRVLSYHIPRSVVMPFDNYRGRIEVSTVPDDSCRVDWGCSVDSGEISEEDCRAAMLGNLDMLLDALGKAFPA